MAEYLSERELRKRKRELKQEEINRKIAEEKEKDLVQKELEMLKKQRELLLRERAYKREKAKAFEMKEKDTSAEEESDESESVDEESVAGIEKEISIECSSESEFSDFKPENVLDSTHYSERKKGSSREEHSSLPDERVKVRSSSEKKFIEKQTEELDRQKQLIAEYRRGVAEDSMCRQLEQETKERQRKVNEKSKRRSSNKRLEFDSCSSDETKGSDRSNMIEKERERLTTLNRKEEEAINTLIQKQKHYKKEERRKAKQVDALLQSISALEILDKELKRKKKRTKELMREIDTSREKNTQLDETLDNLRKREATLLKSLDRNSKTEITREKKIPKEESEKVTANLRSKDKLCKDKMQFREDAESVHNAEKNGDVGKDKTVITLEKALIGRPYLPPFEGRNYDDSKMEVNWLLASNIYSDYVIAQVVRNSLKGHTRKVLTSLSPHTSTKDILAKMDEIYGNIKGSDSLLQEFFSAKQLDKESSSDWGIRLENILQRVIDTGEIDQAKGEDMLRKKFWKGLKSEKLREACRNTYESKETFTALRRKAREEEEDIELRRKETEKEFQRTEQKSEKPAIHKPIKTNSETEAKLDKILDRIKQLEDEMRNYSMLQQQNSQNFLQDKTTNQGWRGRGRSSFRNRGRRGSRNETPQSKESTEEKRSKDQPTDPENDKTLNQ